MVNFSEQLLEILKSPNKYPYDINLYCEVLAFIPYFQDLKENEYIIYHNNKTFEYSAHFYSFIKALHDSHLVEDINEMTEFLKLYHSESAYKIWMKEMNLILSDEELLMKTNISFLKKAVLSMIRLEKVCPGSWGIDVETRNWLNILLQLKRIFPEIYRTEKNIFN